jgi:hypothetical protein
MVAWLAIRENMELLANVVLLRSAGAGGMHQF